MKRRGRTLTDEEQSLWRQVAETTVRRSFAPLTPSQPPPKEPMPTAPRAMDDSRTPVVLKPEGRLAPGVSLPAAKQAAPSGLDRATETRLRRGKREPDARIDLHGMTARAAHSALTRFVEQSRRAGHRMVLVITGKGAPGPARGFGDPAPGVLRREAPIWLSTPPLSSIIVNVSQAHPRHGGGGALYVYLKKIR